MGLSEGLWRLAGADAAGLAGVAETAFSQQCCAYDDS
jgi:hypothetical protein